MSSNSEVLSDSGLYYRPYVSESIIYEATITYGTSSKVCTFEVEVDGFKELNDIAASYVGGNSTTYEALPEELFTICDIITCGFAYPASDGTFTNTTIGSDGFSVNSLNYTHYLPKMASYAIPKAHAEGTWILISICGVAGDYDTALETICKSDEIIDTFVANIINLINTYGFDGVDMDWEVPSDGALFTKLMKKLYAAVKANNPNHLVTAAIGGGMWQPPYYDLGNSCNYVDYINLMTYNMSTSNGYHHTALYPSSSFNNTTYNVGKTLTSCSVSESIKIYNDYGVPSNKIIVGSGFYGIKQTRTLTSDSFANGSSVSYKAIKSTYLTDSSYKYYYDSVSQSPYLISNDGLTFISYENEISVKAKCKYVIDNNLAGVVAWHIGLDNGDLINAMKEGLSK